MSAPITVLVVDPQVLFTDGLRHRLDAEPGITVVGCVTSGEAALTAVAAAPPTVALVELDLPGMNGIATMRALRALCPATALVGLASRVHPGSVFEVVDAGASGLVGKEHTADDLLDAIRTAATGGSSLADRRARAGTGTAGRERRVADRHLTEREVDVLRLAATGLSNRAIAASLHLSEHTVLGYLKSLSVKLGVHSKLQAVVLGISEGLIALPVRPAAGAPPGDREPAPPGR